jgi:hypothetical protein
MTINLDQYTNTLNVTDTATNADLNVATKGTGVVKVNNGGGQTFLVSSTVASPTNYVAIYGNTQSPEIRAEGSTSSLDLQFLSKSTGSHMFYTNGTSYLKQFQVAHTTSAVNYVQVTGAITAPAYALGPVISSQGSDADIGLGITAKGTGTIRLWSTSGFSFTGGSSIFGGNTQFNIASSSTTGNYFSFSGAQSAGNGPFVQPGGVDSNIDIRFGSLGTGSLRFFSGNINGGSGREQLRITNTDSAVNYVQVTGSITGSPVAISAQGSDSNIRMNLFSKGTESIDILTNGGAVRQARFTNTASTVNWVQMTGSATGFGAVIRAAGSDTNIPLVVQPQGTGALQAQQTDSTATGGNARGANAVDWQTSRSAASAVAGGAYAVVGGGGGNGATGTYTTVAGGAGNFATGFGSSVVGGNGNVCSATYAFLGAGQSNTVSGYLSAVCTGISNTAAGVYNFIGGGFTNSATSNSAVTTQSGTMNGTTAVTLSGSNASIKVGQYITGTSIAAETYVAAVSGTSLTLSKVASGSSTSTLSFFTPHGVVVGGGNNTATGSYSFIGGGGDAGTAGNRNVASGDWSTVGGGRTNIASNLYAVISGGFNNTASGQFSSVLGGGFNQALGFGSSVAGGFANYSNATYSQILNGQYGTTRGIESNFVISSSAPLGGSLGLTQSAILIIAVQTTDATATVLRCSASAAATTNQVILPNNSAYFFTGEVVAGVTGGGDTKGWKIEGVIKRGANAASTALVGTPTVTSTYADAGASTWTIAVTADTTNGGLAVTFTGQASTTIRTVAKISTVEMTY